MPSENHKRKQPGGECGQQAARGPKADSASRTGTGRIVPNASRIIAALDPEENVVEGQSSLGQGTKTSLGPDVRRVSGCSTLAMSEDMARQVIRTARAKYPHANEFTVAVIPVRGEREVRELSSLYQRGLDTDQLMVSEDVWQKIRQGMQQLSDRAREEEAAEAERLRKRAESAKREAEREATQQAAAAELKDRRQRGEHVGSKSDRNNPEDVPMTEPKVVCPWCETEGHDVWKCLKANPATGVMEFCPLCLDKGKRTEVAAHHTIDRCHESLSPDEAYKYLVLGRANMPRWMTYHQHWESVVFKRSQAGEHVVPVFPWSDEFSRGYVRRAARDYTIEFKTIAFFYEVQQQFILPEDRSQKLGEVLLRGEAQTQAQRLREQG